MSKVKIKLGDYNTLRCKELARREGYGEVFGIYLEGGEEGDILMPAKYVPNGVKPGDDVRCFVYLDQSERIVATTETPKAVVGQFACLECTWVNQFGAFLDWGVTKNLFCPFHEQKRRMEVGKSYIVYILIDPQSYRLMASARVEHFFAAGQPDCQPAQEVNLLVWQKTPLGFKVIVDNRYPGLIYDDEGTLSLHAGDRRRGYVIRTRPDGKLDISLQPIGRQHTLDFAETLLEWLRAHGGHCPLGDKSDPELIYQQFSVSKKVYKHAVSDLYKRRLITIAPNGISLAG